MNHALRAYQNEDGSFEADMRGWVTVGALLTLRANGLL